MFGLLFWAIIVGVAALVGMRVVPTAVEYYTIMKAINKITAEEPAHRAADPGGVRQAAGDR